VKKVCALLLALPLNASAQEPPPDHPALRDKFYLGAGVYLPRTRTEAQLNSSRLGIGTNIDFERALGFEDSKPVPALFGRWRLSDRWRLEAEYFELNRAGQRGIEREIRWGDTVFPISADVASTFDFSDLRVSVGYSFFRTTDKELGVGVGVHAASYRIALTGTVLGNVVASEAEDVIAPLPVVSVYGQFALTDAWAVSARFDRFKLSFDKYEGSLTSLNLDMLYQPFKHIGFGAGWRLLDIHGKVEDSRTIEFRQSFQGPVLYLTASF
jgi:hypothetical protein